MWTRLDEWDRLVCYKPESRFFVIVVRSIYLVHFPSCLNFGQIIIVCIRTDWHCTKQRLSETKVTNVNTYASQWPLHKKLYISISTNINEPNLSSQQTKKICCPNVNKIKNDILYYFKTKKKVWRLKTTKKKTNYL